MTGDGGVSRESSRPTLLAIDEAAAFVFALVAFAVSTLSSELAVAFGFLGLVVAWILILTRNPSSVRVLTGLGLSAAGLLLGIGPLL